VKLLFIAAAGVAIFGQARVLMSALAGRTPGAAATRLARAREGLWIALPAIGLALVLIVTWRTLHSRTQASEPVASGRTVAATPSSPSAARDRAIGAQP
jgi:hypothetical protein